MLLNINPGNPFRYEPVGICIYCGRRKDILGDEHIVPYSLRGGWILPKASCRNCEREILTYELTCARTIFGDFRIHNNISTRNPKQRPKTIKLGAKPLGDTSTTIEVSRAEYPAPFLYYKFKRAGIISSTPKTLCRFEPTPVMMADGDAIERFKQNHPKWDAIVRMRAAPLELARMLAKIAHGHAVATLKWGTFTPFLQNIILRKTNKVAYLVGGHDEVPPKSPETEHSLGMTLQMDLPGERALIIINIRLFGNCGTPIFHAVAGTFDFRQPLQRQAFEKCMDSAEEADFPV